MMSIKFDHSHDGELALGGKGKSCLGHLMPLGALAHTRTAQGVFATDLEGLVEAQEAADSAIIAFAGHLQTIGNLLAYADEGNVADCINDIGWLLHSFGEHIQDLSNLRTELTEAIDTAKPKQTAKKGGVQ